MYERSERQHQKKSVTKATRALGHARVQANRRRQSTPNAAGRNTCFSWTIPALSNDCQRGTRMDISGVDEIPTTARLVFLQDGKRQLEKTYFMNIITSENSAQLTRPLDVWECLMIRACKSNSEPVSRLKRVFAKRCGLKTKHVKLAYVTEFLAGILESRQLCSLTGFLAKISEQNEWQEMGRLHRGKNSAEPIDPTLLAAISILRFTEVKLLPECRPPLVWRKVEEKEKVGIIKI